MERWSMQQHIFCVEQFMLGQLYACSKSSARDLVIIGKVGLHLQEK
jgi:hypothetical protein